MSKKPSEFSTLLNSEQPPVSPDELDLKILQHAEKHKPAKRLAFRWSPILATISVVSIAVLLTFQQPQHDGIDQTMNPQFNRISADLSDQAESSQVESSQAEIPQVESAQAESSAVVVPRKPKQSLGQGVAERAVSAKPVREKKSSFYKTSGAPASLSTERRQYDANAELRVAEENAANPNEDLLGLLKKLQEMLLEGNSAEAHNEYNQLKDNCRECDLPDKLEAALEQRLK